MRSMSLNDIANGEFPRAMAEDALRTVKALEKTFRPEEDDDEAEDLSAWDASMEIGRAHV